MKKKVVKKKIIKKPVAGEHIFQLGQFVRISKAGITHQGKTGIVASIHDCSLDGSMPYTVQLGTENRSGAPRYSYYQDELMPVEMINAYCYKTKAGEYLWKSSDKLKTHTRCPEYDMKKPVNA